MRDSARCSAHCVLAPRSSRLLSRQRTSGAQSLTSHIPLLRSSQVGQRLSVSRPRLPTAFILPLCRPLPVGALTLATPLKYRTGPRVLLSVSLIKKASYLPPTSFQVLYCL